MFELILTIAALLFMAWGILAAVTLLLLPLYLIAVADGLWDWLTRLGRCAYPLDDDR